VKPVLVPGEPADPGDPMPRGLGPARDPARSRGMVACPPRPWRVLCRGRIGVRAAPRCAILEEPGKSSDSAGAGERWRWGVPRCRCVAARRA